VNLHSAWPALPVALVACTSLFGLDELRYEAQVGGGGSSVAVSGSGGDAPASTSASASASSSGPSSGVGGSRSGCADGCSIDMKCSVIDLISGEKECVAAGTVPVWAACVEDTECQAGHWCDGPTGMFKPIFSADVGCGAGSCKPAQGPIAQIPMLLVCTAHCDPVSTAPCDPSVALTSCLYDVTTGEFDCARVDGGLQYDPCIEPDDCGAGMRCTSWPGAPADVCMVWCTPLGNDECAGGGGSGKNCVAHSPAVFYDGAEHGFCVP